MNNRNKDIFFSIIVPVYNVEDFLVQCIDSILCQTYANFEIIMVNDGSTDSSPEICSLYKKKDTRNRIIHKENGGLSDARNVGLLQAKGDYVIFTDSDDYWEGNRVLEELNNLIKESYPDLIIHEESRFFSKNHVKCKYNQQFINNKTEDFRKEVELLVYYDLFAACAWDKIVRRTILIDNKLFFPIGRKSEDMEWCSRLINHIDTYAIYPKSFYIYRQGRLGSITFNLSENHMMDVYEMIKQGLNAIKDTKSSLNIPLVNYWAINYAAFLKDFYVLSSNNRNIIWNDLVSWKYLLKEGRNIKVDKVMKFYNFMPFVMLPIFLNIYRIVTVFHKKYKTLK
nr:glycosyltransferase family 2 protein [uncultured Flavobacterium sp.]